MNIRVVTRQISGRRRLVVTDHLGEPLPNQRSVVIDQRGDKQVVSIALEMDGNRVALDGAPLIQGITRNADCSCGTSKVCEQHEGSYIDGNG